MDRFTLVIPKNNNNNDDDNEWDLIMAATPSSAGEEDRVKAPNMETEDKARRRGANRGANTEANRWLLFVIMKVWFQTECQFELTLRFLLLPNVMSFISGVFSMCVYVAEEEQERHEHHFSLVHWADLGPEFDSAPAPGSEPAPLGRQWLTANS